MKKLTFLSTWLLLTSLMLTSLSPVYSAGGGEITPIPKVNKEFLIVAHIVTNSDSLPEIEETDIINQMKVVNTYFAPLGVTFTVCEFKYIYNYNYNRVNLRTYNELVDMARVNSRINMFFLSEFNGDPGPLCGLATLGGIDMANNGAILILKGSCATSHTIAHELGHYFSLEHTFETRHGIELVDGSNCTTTGDRVCDTPADPYVHSDKKGPDYISDDCIFINTTKDSNGAYYSPDVSNIMSYYDPKCTCQKFSHDQYVKMANHYLSNPVMW